MDELKMGPVIFREEAIFKREIKPSDDITLDAEMVKATPDFSRWCLRHHFMKGDGSVAAILTVDGAWMDLEKRKLAKSVDFIREVFDAFPKAADFVSG